jgi:electron-transferring-flavoprotein dehydrogenase
VFVDELDFTILADGAVTGVATGDMGVGREGMPGPSYQPGIDLLARYTLFAEGYRGHLGKQLESQFSLRRGRGPQVYGLGVKELWQVGEDQHRPGLVLHTAGWPLDHSTYGGGFLYHGEGGQVALGLVVGLGYRNSYLSPFEEFQRWKTHPAIRTVLQGGTRIAYGARAIAAGGFQALPKLVFPGGALIGDDAGFLNAARIKGSHAALKSGMLAAEACFAACAAGRSRDELEQYPAAYQRSWLYQELKRARNFKPWMSKGLVSGSLMVGIDQLLLRGRAPWTLRLRADHIQLRPAAQSDPIRYPKPDGVLSFDRMSSVFLSSTNHAEQQPCHLRLRNPETPMALNLAIYDSPESRYCPAGVYEIVRQSDSGAPRLQINAQNCLHCKACDVKDPTQNIDWVAPEGGGGPNYSTM